MKKIFLTQGKFALVDDDKYDELMQWKWYAQKDGLTYYARRDVRFSKSKKISVSMHQHLIGCVKGKVIDHKNNNGLDNQFGNLRHVTQAQNLWNMRKKGSGVRYRTKKKKWEAAIWHIGQYIYIGMFDTEYAAKFAVAITKRYFRGEFA